MLTTVTSTSAGAVSYTHKPSWSISYRWQYAGSTALFGTTSAAVAVSVRTSVTAAVSATSMKLGKTVTISGTVGPKHTGKVTLQRLSGTRWVAVTTASLTSSSNYSFKVKPTARGSYSYRVVKPADTDHAEGISTRRAVKVT